MINCNRRVVLAGVAGLMMFGMSSVSGASAAAPAFAMVQINQQALFFNQMLQGAQGAAKKAGVTLDVFNANDRPADQNNAIETYIQQKVAGIPVVAVDSLLPENGPQKVQIGVDNDKAGQLLADVFLPYVHSSMGGKVKIGVVGALNSFIQNQRQKAFLNAIAGKPGVSMAGVVDGRNIQDNALAVAETLLTGNPDMTAIYATPGP